MPGAGKNTSETEPEGAPPQADDPMNRPGLTNGVPDGLDEGDAAAVPDSSRQDAETSGGG